MRWTRRVWIGLAAVSGFIAVAAGAFAAHGMSDPAAKELMRTGSTYEMFHALATILCSTVMRADGQRARFAPALFLGGSALFSGSLYALAFGAPRLVGIVTPFGGLAFLAGWAVLVWAALEVDQAA
jgi:uncharacterized membrane protein YgdD (TMEM256/DUF423 family)